MSQEVLSRVRDGGSLGSASLWELDFDAGNTGESDIGQSTAGTNLA